MARIRDLPNLQDKIALFAQYLRDEHQYTALSYGCVLNENDQVDGLHYLQDGIPQEWLEIYHRCGYQAYDSGLRHVFSGHSVLLKSQTYRMARDRQLHGPELSAALQSNEFFKSGFCFRVGQVAVPTGIALHSKTLEDRQHDQYFARHELFLTELCRQFDTAVSWGDSIIDKTGLTEQNLRVLRVLAKGNRKAEMLEELGMQSYTSIATHMARVRKLLQVSTDNQALRRAAALALI